MTLQLDGLINSLYYLNHHGWRFLILAPQDRVFPKRREGFVWITTANSAEHLHCTKHSALHLVWFYLILTMTLRGRLLLPPFYTLENQGLERLNSFCPRAHRASVDYWHIIRKLNQMGTKRVHWIEQRGINRQDPFHAHPKTELRSDTICFTFFPNLVQPRGPEASILQQQKVSQPEEGEGPEKGAWKGRTQEARLGAPLLAAVCHRRWGAPSPNPGGQKWVLPGTDVGQRRLWGERDSTEQVDSARSFPTQEKLTSHLDVTNKLTTSPFKACCQVPPWKSIIIFQAVTKVLSRMLSAEPGTLDKGLWLRARSSALLVKKTGIKLCGSRAASPYVCGHNSDIVMERKRNLASGVLNSLPHVPLWKRDGNVQELNLSRETPEPRRPLLLLPSCRRWLLHFSPNLIM